MGHETRQTERLLLGRKLKWEVLISWYLKYFVRITSWMDEESVVNRIYLTLIKQLRLSLKIWLEKLYEGGLNLNMWISNFLKEDKVRNVKWHCTMSDGMSNMEDSPKIGGELFFVMTSRKKWRVNYTVRWQPIGTCYKRHYGRRNNTK